ncbi:hypothetical protein BD626DRAFT_488400 [Schizophyllum amplum]|uniref:Uncharacterized protein n=1 Tax=Schizophyllum amplum TaxID=97359 RepID=A0A550CKJ1_9AGAR|nr:hypothetical protein BD626DRAFT_488400 [Auriculariopsis ampla]
MTTSDDFLSRQAYLRVRLLVRYVPVGQRRIRRDRRMRYRMIFATRGTVSALRLLDPRDRPRVHSHRCHHFPLRVSHTTRLRSTPRTNIAQTLRRALGTRHPGPHGGPSRPERTSHLPVLRDRRRVPYERPCEQTRYATRLRAPRGGRRETRRMTARAGPR